MRRIGSRRTFIQNASRGVASLFLASSRVLKKPPASVRYFIDTAGDNRRSGTSPDQAWADFTNVNTKTFLPGDAILLRRGCVWRQQFTLNSAGAMGGFITIDAYGTGARPKIQRTDNPSDRCMRLNNASYVRLSSVEVCNGGVGILLYYDRSYDNRSVYIDDVLAHDFSFNGVSKEDPHDRVTWSYGIGVTGMDLPERGQDRVLSDLRITNTEVYRTGAGVALDWANHHTMDGKNVLRNKFGDVFMENLNLHDNTVDGIAFVSLFLASVTDCLVKNSVIDRGARFAPTGTAAVQIMYSKGVTLLNVAVSNTLLNACPDNAAVDLECDNEDTLIDNCRFENNAGPAIEILATPGNANAYTRNLMVRNCTFIYNNWAKKLGTYQISVPDWVHGNAPSGRIQNNEYRNAPGTTFFGGDGNTSQLKVSANIALHT